MDDEGEGVCFGGGSQGRVHIQRFERFREGLAGFKIQSTVLKEGFLRSNISS
jgi:hypothetical protein